MKYFQKTQRLIGLPESDTLKNIVAITLSILVIAIVIILSFEFLYNNKQVKKIKIAGGPKGMTFSNIATGLKHALSKDNEVNEFINTDSIIIITTDGSQDNLNLVCTGKVDLALIHSNANIDSLLCNGIKTILNLQKSKLHIISSDPKVKKLDDITEKTKLYVGKNKSGTNFTSKKILKYYGLNTPKIEQEIKFTQTIDKINEGENLVAFFIGGAPIENIEKIKTEYKKSINFIPLTNSEALKERYKYSFPDTIKKGIYGYFKKKVLTPFPSENIPTMGMNTLLVASEKFSEQNPTRIKKIIAAINNNRYDFNVHSAMIFDKSFAVEDPIIFPLHPGSMKYFNGTELIPPKMLKFFEETGSILAFILALITALVSLIVSYRNYQFDIQKMKIVTKTLGIKEELYKEKSTVVDIQEFRKDLMRLNDRLIKCANLNKVSLKETEHASKFISGAIQRCDYYIEKIRE